jgi:hypothetical protein
MTNHLLVDALNNGLTKVLKDISNTYELDFKELTDRYLVKATQKKPKRKGHVSAYNIFVKETRPDIVSNNPNLGFAEIAAQVSQLWAEAKKDDKRMEELEQKKLEYVNNKDGGEMPVIQEEVAKQKKPLKKKKLLKKKKV